MHSKIIYYWDADDPIEPGKRLDQAFNRVLSFCPELLVPPGDKDARTPESISLNRVVGGEFDMSDVTRLSAYASLVSRRIVAKWGTCGEDFAKSCLQAGENLVAVTAQVRDCVHEYARSMRGMNGQVGIL